MIDTIYLHTPINRLKVSDNVPLQVKPGTFHNDTGEIYGDNVLYYRNGVPVHGNNAFYNHDFYHIVHEICPVAFKLPAII